MFDDVLNNVTDSQKMRMNELYKKAREAKLKGDDSDAIKWYQEAAEMGHGSSMEALGRSFCETKDFEKGKVWLKRASVAGEKCGEDVEDAAFAEFLLGGIYELEEKNIKEAKIWYEKSANHGNSDAMNQLGAIFWEEGNKRASKDWAMKAAEQGSEMGQLNFAKFCADEGQYSQAIHWFEKAALKDERAEKIYKIMHEAVDLNDVAAQRKLGALFREGKELFPNGEMAVKWYMKAVNRGDVKDQGALALLYLEGIDGMPDYDEAEKWAKMAKKNGDAFAEHILELINREKKK